MSTQVNQPVSLYPTTNSSTTLIQSTREGVLSTTDIKTNEKALNTFKAIETTVNSVNDIMRSRTKVELGIVKK